MLKSLLNLLHAYQDGEAISQYKKVTDIESACNVLADNDLAHCLDSIYVKWVKVDKVDGNYFDMVCASDDEVVFSYYVRDRSGERISSRGESWGNSLETLVRHKPEYKDRINTLLLNHRYLSSEEIDKPDNWFFAPSWYRLNVTKDNVEDYICMVEDYILGYITKDITTWVGYNPILVDIMHPILIQYHTKV